LKTIHIEILGEPKPQPRHRHFTRGKFSGTYDPAKDKKNSFLSCMLQHAPEKPIETAIIMDIKFYFLRPKGDFGTGRNSGKLKKSAPVTYIKGPDIDNLQKFVFDAMNKVFFRDDRQIWKVTAEKLYGVQAMTVIEMRYYE